MLYKEKIYDQDRKQSRLYILENITIETHMTVYKFVNPETEQTKTVNTLSHVSFTSYLVKEKIALDTKMLLFIDESGNVQYCEILT